MFFVASGSLLEDLFRGEMVMSFKKIIIKKILNRTDVVKIIGTFLPLKQRGKPDKREYLTLCPFHSEITPSFTVTGVKHFYHCFGCGAHGNAIAFVQEYTRISWSDAIKKVAELSNFKLPMGKSNPSNKKIADRKKYHKKLKRREKVYQGRKNTPDDKEESFSAESLGEDIPF